LKIRLENLGYHVPGIALNGEDAIKKTREKNPDLILMNVILNGKLNGIETAQHIRKQHNIPFIYLTGNTHNNTILERARITEPSGYISKPFDDNEIQNTIKMAINTE
jgi:CheY-like chemotaxis protein